MLLKTRLPLLTLVFFTASCNNSSIPTSRDSEFISHVDPIAISSINNGTTQDQASIQYWEQTYLSSCKYYVELGAISGKQIKPFSDKECLFLMYKHRPNIKGLNKR